MEKYKKVIHEEFPDGSYSVSDVQDYFKRNIKKHEPVTDNHCTKMEVFH